VRLDWGSHKAGNDGGKSLLWRGGENKQTRPRKNVRKLGEAVNRCAKKRKIRKKKKKKSENNIVGGSRVGRKNKALISQKNQFKKRAAPTKNSIAMEKKTGKAGKL